MGFNCGIVGLPNVGKSTLFNAITSTAAAAAANYPFCTIEPNVGRVPVPDPRLEVVARIAGSPQVVPTQLEVVDIAGLVRGASRGEGLGNRFLGAIRAVDAVLHVLRCFASDDVAHVEGSVDPVRDAELVETELLLADLASLERRVDGLTKRVRGGDKEAQAQLALIERILPALQAGAPARRLALAAEDRPVLRDAAAADREAPALRLQRRGGRRGRRQSPERPAWPSAPRPRAPAAWWSQPRSRPSSPGSGRTSAASTWPRSASSGRAWTG